MDNTFRVRVDTSELHKLINKVIEDKIKVSGKELIIGIVAVDIAHAIASRMPELMEVVK